MRQTHLITLKMNKIDKMDEALIALIESEAFLSWKLPSTEKLV